MKKYILIVFGIILFSVVICFAIKKNNEIIIQGEIETKTADLSSKITGRIKQINVKEGETVQKGQILIVLDTPDYEAKMDRANADVEIAKSKELELINGTREEEKAIALNKLLKAKSDAELAEKTYNRLKNLNEEGVISNQKADEAYTYYQNSKQAFLMAKNNYEMQKNGSRYEDKLMASAKVKQAKGFQREIKSYLDESTIKAPISGEITDIIAEEGEIASAGYTIISITDTNDNWVVFNLKEDLLTKIKIGTIFDVEIPAIGKTPVKVKVDYISVMGDFATQRATKIRGDFDLKTFEVHARPVIPINGLRAGMSVIAYPNKIGK